MRFECLKTYVKSGENTYPVYIAFAKASSISEVAEAPAFAESTPNSEIATNVLTPPVAKWQRPLNETTVEAIVGMFDNTGRLMPNPVLLAKNPLFPTDLPVEQQTVGGINPTDIWYVNVPNMTSDGVKPLWILDGQHRIQGLAGSMQRDNSIPLVLLLNEEDEAYGQARLAGIFAEVTTTSARLDPLHNEWMSYSFGLGRYAQSHGDSADQRNAMETAALMCKDPQLGTGVPNPFFNKIKFNPKSTPGVPSIGFEYDCIEMQKLLYRAYFKVPTGTGVKRLKPNELAQQLGLAYRALKGCVKAPQTETVFFGDSRYAQRVMQDAFMVAVCCKLLSEKSPIDWLDLLKKLKFTTTKWDFTGWIVSMGGKEQTTSKKIAERVLAEAFRNESVPGAGDIVNYLKGDGAGFKVRVMPVLINGKADESQEHECDLVSGSVKGLRCVEGVRRKAVVAELSSNVGSLEVIDKKKSDLGSLVKIPKFVTKSGIVLDPTDGATYTNPLELQFKMHLYGGSSNYAMLDIEWCAGDHD